MKMIYKPTDSRGRLPVLMYHSISRSESAKSDPLVVPVSALRRQLTTLARDGWELVGLTEALEIRAKDPARRVAALTFDDGFFDFLNATEVLDQLGARATLYVPTAHIGLRETGPNGVPPALRWDHLRALSRCGIEIGSHSRHHRPLDVCSSRTLLDETHGSRVVLEDRLGVTVRSFSFPHGYTSPRVRRAVMAAHYTNACIVGRRVARPDDDWFSIPRLQMYPDLTDDELHRLVENGEPGVTPTVKRVVSPAWRAVRFMSSRLLDTELT